MVNYSDIVDPSQLDTADTDNPDGVFQDFVSGSKPGTPIIQSWFQTPYYFFRKLIKEGSNADPDGNIDNFTDNQPFNALNTFVNTKVKDETTDLVDAIDNQNLAYNFSRYDFNDLVESSDLGFVPKASAVSKRTLLDGTDDSVIVTVGTDYPFVGDWVGVAINDNSTLTVAVSNGKIAYSIDRGSSWVQNNITGDWKDISYSSSLGLFIAVKENAYASSLNGADWTEVTKTGVWTNVACSDENDSVVIAGGTDYSFSFDFQTWQDGSTFSGSVKLLECYNNTFFAVIDSGTLLRGGFVVGGFFSFTQLRVITTGTPLFLACNKKTNGLSYGGSTGGGSIFYVTDFDASEVVSYSLASSFISTGVIAFNGIFTGHFTSGDKGTL